MKMDIIDLCMALIGWAVVFFLVGVGLGALL